jgi:hypothetical protein
MVSEVGSTVVGVVDLREWFADDELQPCPCCGLRSAFPTPSGGYVVCIECGLLTAEGEPIGDLREPPSAD